MNHWAAHQMPSNWHPKNITLSWAGTDNAKTLAGRPVEEAIDWHRAYIQYAYNQQGFRCPDLNNFIDQPVDVALGCSFTKGVGMPVEAVWPSLVQRNRPYPMLNLGLGGGTTDTVARILTNISTLFKIQTAFILWPHANRFETYTDSYVDRILPYNAQTEHVWFMDGANADQRYQKNHNIAHTLSKLNQFNIVELTVNEVYQKGFAVDTARDGLHLGYRSNQLLAKWYLDTLTSK